MHTFSPGEDVDRRASTRCSKPLLHLHTQANVELPWADIDFDFMNLNQAAHGDREFGYIETRLGVARKTVVGHVSEPRRAAPGRATGSAPRPAGPRRTQLKLARFGDNMRYVAVTEGDKTEAELRFGVAGQHVGRERPRRRRATRRPTPTSTRWSPSTLDLYDVVPELRPGGDRHESLRYGAAIEVGLRTFLEEGGFERVHDDLRGPRRAAPAARARRAAADGRRLRVRRRGRLEDRDPRARRERDGRGPARRRVA